MVNSQRIRIGDLLVSKGKLTQEDLMKALQIQKQSGDKLGEILVSEGMTTEADITNTLSKQLGLPTVDLINHELDISIANLLDETRAKKLRALPVFEMADGLVLVAMSDPSDGFAIEEVERRLKREIQVGVIGESALSRAIAEAFKDRKLNELVSELSSDVPEAEFNLGSLLQDVAASDAPAARVLKIIFDDAVESQASDIHIEPISKGLLLRLRVDGVLRERVVNDTQVSKPLTSRLKLMAGLNISERRVPQDGRFSISAQNRSLDVRVSTLPGQYGESVVMRLLDQTNALRPLTQLGFGKDIETKLTDMLKRPQGMILVTGPTGSGKTTTLYSMINALNTPERKIITAEDPVEYRIHRVTQVQADDKVGLTFAEILKSSLRQDPDVILVGEMRDLETATIGVRAAMTGHLVLSTLHTNDTVGAISRLIDLGVPPYLLATSLQGIMAQRLLRKVCPNCATTYSPDEGEKRWLANVMRGPVDTEEMRFGQGCDSCHQTGYSGRLPIHELLVPKAEAMRHLQAGNIEAFNQSCFEDPQFSSLSMSSAKLALSGKTTIAEAMKVASDSHFNRHQPLEPVEDGNVLVS